MTEIFNDKNYLLCKVGYSLIHFIEIKTGNSLYLIRSNTGKYRFKINSATCSAYPNLLNDLNSINLKSLEDKLWENLEIPISNHFRYYFDLMIPNGKMAMDNLLQDEIENLLNNDSAKEYSFENKLKNDEVVDIILCGLLHLISKKHLLSGNIFDKFKKQTVIKSYFIF